MNRRTLRSAIRRAHAQLELTDATSAQAHAPLVPAVQEIVDALPAPSDWLGQLLRLALVGVRSLATGTAAEPVRPAVLTALQTADRALGMRATGRRDAAVGEAGRTILGALGWDASDWLAAPSSASSSPLTLDDAAAMLVQLDPADVAEMQRVRDAFHGIALDASFSPWVREAVVGAEEHIEQILRGGCADVHAALAATNQLIESAMGGEAPPPAAAARPHPAPAGDILPPDADLDLLREFLAESAEYLDGAESALLALEHAPDDEEALNTVFRAFHTVKGTSAFLGLSRVTAFAHDAESLLSRVRAHELPYTRRCADLALRSVDMLKTLLRGVEDALGGAPMEAPSDYDELTRLLRAGEVSGAPGQDAAVRSGAAGDVPSAPPAPRDGASEAGADGYVRVRTDRLDRLMDWVGELVIAHSMIAQDPALAHGANHELARKVSHAGKIVRELQDLSTLMRMVPLRATFRRMSRLVRDLTQRTGKAVELVVEGEDTEIDRTMADTMVDPLVHMIRNAVDHGIEPPEERAACGKPRTGTILLAARRQGGSIVVELRDNGRGLDRERILAKAVARGLVDERATLSDADVYELIFAPGFSTAAQVTDVSGRGVGMDVVRRHVEALHGTVDIDSRPGKGTTFTVRLPLTRAITDGMLVRIGTERYLVPTAQIHLSFRPDRSMLSTVAGRGEMALLRGELLPIVRLHRLFDIRYSASDPTRGLLVVVSAPDGRRCALLVDELLGQQQVVAKPVSDGIGRVAGVAGAAILGDGRVGLILDAAELVAATRAATRPAA